MATAEQWAALRAMIETDWDRHADLTQRLTAGDGLGDYGTLLGAAYYLAVRRQFPAGHSVGDVIRFAARVRAKFDTTGEDVDPRPIELVARAALGEQGVGDHLDDKAVVTAQTLTLAALAHEGGLGDPDAFAREVEALAEKWGA